MPPATSFESKCVARYLHNRICRSVPKGDVQKFIKRDSGKPQEFCREKSLHEGTDVFYG
jgi:hypothetical protein